MQSFQAEAEAFEKALPKLLEEHRVGEYAVLRSCNVEKVLPTYEQALRWGYEQFGLEEHFFIKQVQEPQQVMHFRRIR